MKYNTQRLRNHPLYSIWYDMKRRCYNKKRKDYYLYGGRGISVYECWKNDFKEFYDWAIKNGWKQGLKIDRINNNGDYEPTNCQFVTNKVNCNNKRTNINITWNGKTQTRTEWEEELGFPKTLIRERLRMGWSIEKSLTTPFLNKKKKFYTYKGITNTLSTWAKEYKISQPALHYRISNGYSIKEALETPVGAKK